MKLPIPSKFRDQWALDPGTTFLNHGSFGACPIVVLEEQTRLRQLLEADPMGFFFGQGTDLWQEALVRFSRFVNADPAGMTFQTNATTGVNTILRSLVLKPSDEIILSDHAYQACRNTIDYVCKRSDAKVVVVAIPFGEVSSEAVTELFLQAVTDRSRLAMVETVTSPTGMRMPFERLTLELQSRGVDVLVDGAHGPGLIPLDIEALGAAYFVGNCHKWLCTPKGSGFLHIREDRRHIIKPLIISHGYSTQLNPAEKFREEFDWQGTGDPTPWLCIPKAIEYVGSLLDGGWDELMARNHALALRAREILCTALDTDAALPHSMITALVTVELPAVEAVAGSTFKSDPLMVSLLKQYRIQVVVFPWVHHQTRYLRVSAALYNSEPEYEYLADALGELLKLR